MSAAMDDRQKARPEADPSSSLLKTSNTESEGCSGMNVLQKFGVNHAQEALATAVEAGMISEEHLHGDVVDFGCGGGGSSWVLAKNGARVTAIDLQEKSLDMLRALGVLDASAIRCKDGIDYLNSLAAGSLDMVTAFMLGPDINGNLVGKFYQAANHALKVNGRLIVTSDPDTRQTFQAKVAQGFGFSDGHVFMGLKNPGTSNSPSSFDHETFCPPFGPKKVFNLFGDGNFRLSHKQQAPFAEIFAKFKPDLGKKS